MFFDFWNAMFDVMDINQSDSTKRIKQNLQKMSEIVASSGFEADKKALNSDYLKIRGDFDKSINKVLYDKKAS
jgi:negative regulator of replication initiation